MMAPGRAQLLHVARDVGQHGDVAQAAEHAAGPSVSPMHWSTPYFSGIS
jgi:hypothetical protein